MRHGYPANIAKAGRMPSVSEIDPDDLAFLGFFRIGLHAEPIKAEGGNDELIVALRINGKMQITAVGTKAREKLVSIAEISAPAGCKVFAAVKMPGVEPVQVVAWGFASGSTRSAMKRAVLSPAIS